MGQTPRVLNYSLLNELEKRLISKSMCFFHEKNQIEEEPFQSQYHLPFPVILQLPTQCFAIFLAMPRLILFDVCIYLCLKDIIFVDIFVLCRTGLRGGLQGTGGAVDGSMSPPSIRTNQSPSMQESLFNFFILFCIFMISAPEDAI